jgi:hypothetical protein
VSTTATTEGFVSNEALRHAFLASGITGNELAVRAGLMRTYSAPRRGGTGRSFWRGGDATAALRDLGLKPEAGKGIPRGRMRAMISEEKALRYAKALHLDPMDIGL